MGDFFSGFMSGLASNYVFSKTKFIERVILDFYERCKRPIPKNINDFEFVFGIVLNSIFTFASFYLSSILKVMSKDGFGINKLHIIGQHLPNITLSFNEWLVTFSVLSLLVGIPQFFLSSKLSVIILSYLKKEITNLQWVNSIILVSMSIAIIMIAVYGMFFHGTGFLYNLKVVFSVFCLCGVLFLSGTEKKTSKID